MVNTNTSILISQIFQSRKVVLELMEAQGFDVSGYNKFSVSEVNAMKQNNQLDMLLETKAASEEATSKADDSKADDSKASMVPKKVYIRYYLGKTIRPAHLQEMIEDLFYLTETLQKQDTLYIILKEHVNESLLNELKDIWERDGIFIVIETLKSLQFNVLKHAYVPPHSVMSEEEVEQVMKAYNITNKADFPDISRFDPPARAIGLRPGQVCKIVRSSKTASEANYYRLCV